ncbi:GDSL-type esterase/lipase family protein [Kurthia sibirica]|uniref:SGNH hydrolase-type esterase domain-containing protein n=1 Tax=Kurthia sibirica TaxID=202750 RepID=A0A2U3APF1_9BACL|nr:GDSL-type esterase/lipase family protein [Kurthia sibirica]PWI26386.1 hypothetical protein DEX24_03360 [Kurthia sibirica]GEK34177.1 hypothetical protein KSI01_17100 [Kurthia sibirica]
MKKIVLFMVAIAVVLSGCGIVSNFKDEKNLEKKTIHVVAMGDSLTVGVGDEEDKGGYIGRLASAMPNDMDGVKDVKVTNTALKGRRSDELITQIKSGDLDDDLKKADVISLTIGGNDLMKIVRENMTNLTKATFDKERATFNKRYKEVFDLIRQRNEQAPIILLGLYNPLTVYTEDPSELNAILKEWNGDMQKIAKKDGYAQFIAVEDLFDSNDNEVYSEDYFHPNAKGYQLMTQRIEDTLRKNNLLKLSGGTIDFKDVDKDEK